MKDSEQVTCLRTEINVFLMTAMTMHI